MNRSRKTTTIRVPFRTATGKALGRSAVFASALVLVAAFMGGTPVLAQSGSDLQQLMERVERLQRDLNTLQTTVYQGKTPSVASGGMTVEPNLAAAMQIRMDEIESQVRALTGRIEETNHAVGELDRKMEKVLSDIDLRLQALEGGRPTGGQGGQLGEGAGEPVGDVVGPGMASPGQGYDSGSSAGGSSAGPAPASQRGVLGTISPDDLQRQQQAAGQSGGQTGTAAPQTQTASRGPALPQGSPEEQYKFATGLLFQTDYAGAEKAFTAFLDAHPKHELAGNAQYWLGETFYVRGDYASAAHAFARGYQNYPKSSKGPDNLLKLALSLKSIQKKDQACLTLERLGSDFPNAPGRIKARAVSERKALGC